MDTPWVINHSTEGPLLIFATFYQPLIKCLIFEQPVQPARSIAGWLPMTGFFFCLNSAVLLICCKKEFFPSQFVGSDKVSESEGCRLKLSCVSDTFSLLPQVTAAAAMISPLHPSLFLI